MRILILGGDGMLGHQLLKRLSGQHEVRVTLRQNFAAYSRFSLFDAANAVACVDLAVPEKVDRLLDEFRPQTVINAAGIVKRRAESNQVIPSLEINSLLPHRLVLSCRKTGARLIHMSTDCVFSGKAGNYRESDTADAEDLYGRSKMLGEVQGPQCLTLRKSLIGRELSRKTELLEWLLAQKGHTVKGFKNAVFSGFTTIEFSRIIERLLAHDDKPGGLYHVSSEPISKFDLLTLINQKLNLDIKIIPDHEFKCDRSLDSSRFRQEFGYTPPSWKAMIGELADQYNEEIYAV